MNEAGGDWRGGVDRIWKTCLVGVDRSNASVKTGGVENCLRGNGRVPGSSVGRK